MKKHKMRILKLPEKYDHKKYLQAYRELEPKAVWELDQNSSDTEIVFWSVKKFNDYMTELMHIDRARSVGFNKWIIHWDAIQIMVHMNILPILLHEGIQITFEDYESTDGITNS